jgi:hypothetical protein
MRVPGWEWIGNGVRIMRKLRQKLVELDEVGFLKLAVLPKVVLVPDGCAVGCVVLA